MTIDRAALREIMTASGSGYDLARAQFGPSDVVELLDLVDDLQGALDRVASEGRLGCVVEGETTRDGKPAKVCREIIGHHQHMCAGCAARRLVTPRAKGHAAETWAVGTSGTFKETT